MTAINNMPVTDLETLTDMLVAMLVLARTTANLCNHMGKTEVEDFADGVVDDLAARLKVIADTLRHLPTDRAANKLFDRIAEIVHV